MPHFRLVIKNISKIWTTGSTTRERQEKGQYWPRLESNILFSVTRRSRSDESHLLTELLSYLLSVSIDFSDATLVSDDAYRRLY